MSHLIYYLVCLLFAGAVFALGFVFNKKSQKVYSVLCKVFSLLLATFFILRYMWDLDQIFITLSLQSVVFNKKVLNFFAIILVWFTYTSNILLELYGFFKIKKYNSFIKFVSFPISLINFLFLGFNFSAIMGNGSVNNFSIRGFWFAIELGIAFGYSLLVLITTTDWKNLFKKKEKQIKVIDENSEEEILKKYHKRKNVDKNTFWQKIKAFFMNCFYGIKIALLFVCKFFKKHWFAIFTVIVLFLSTMPSYTIEAIFGFAHQIYKAKDFEIPHRIILYVGLILPFIIHYSLKSRDYYERKFYLLFICLGTLLSYSFTKKFDSFLDPTQWPLHLCNTAMYIMPIVLMFNMKRSFYFTYFINVIGAFLAMIMPNYDASVNIFNYSLVNFYINHYIAFFMPILFVSLKMFEKPKFKQFMYSMIGFAVYFAFVIFINSLYTGLFEAGKVARATDYFFVNSDFIADKLGEWAKRLRDVTVAFSVGGIKLTFYPVYQVLFFLVYVLLGLGVWFVYEQGYQIANNIDDMNMRRQKVRLEQIALMTKMNGRSLSEPMNPENENKLILRNFTKRYGNSEVLAVDNANLEVNGGEVFGFLGPNGAGKSTIIKTIVGIQPITSGEVEVCGYDINLQPVEAKRCIGFVPDHYALYEKLTGREYINYIADLYNVPIKERNERIDAYIKRFELEGAFDNQIKTYSHGMKQKITIMAALVHDPKIWILDEPLTGLDPNSIYQVKECMKDRAKEGNIVFFSSHIIDVVEKICDRIAIIKKGHIIVTKTLKEIEASGESLEDFYMNIINENNVEASKVEKVVETLDNKHLVKNEQESISNKSKNKKKNK